MRLSDFILSDMEGILAEWEVFAAAQLPGAADMPSLELRDHAQDILQAVALDISKPQSSREQSEKSKGRAPRFKDSPETAAETHAMLRERSGFDINQLIAEYRALRASVLVRWANACKPADTNLQDMVRFNEGIDQAVAESVAFFTVHVDQGRNLFLGMLGHDIRNPLSTIQFSAGYIAKLNAEGDVANAAARILRSGSRIQALIDDLVDFNRVRFGLGMDVSRIDTDLAYEVAEELKQLRAGNPGRNIDLTVEGDARGAYDVNRFHQLLGNLVSNALNYGDADKPVRVSLVAQPTEVVLAVKNQGPVIDPTFLSRIFDPLQRGPAQQADGGRDGNLGLGLYISREIARAHGGTIDAKSDATETAFTVRFPRK